MWLTGHLAPDFKTIADFRRDNGTGIRNACKQFIAICRELNLFSQAVEPDALERLLSAPPFWWMRNPGRSAT